MCVECVSRGLHGPAVIGMDKPCVEGFTGGRDLWEHKERRGRVGTRRKKVATDMGNVGRGIRSEREHDKILRQT